MKFADQFQITVGKAEIILYIYYIYKYIYKLILETKKKK